ncbi:MAG: hypothetical protein ABR543_04300 [Gemmatimonadaceae bacterium]
MRSPCLFLVVLVAAAVSSCADFESPEDPTGGLPDVAISDPSFSADIQPIFTKRCSIGGCHSLASRQGDLVLVSGFAYDSLVRVPAVLNPSFERVEPGDSDSSWLVRMIDADPARRNNNARMPLLSTPLTPNQIATIVNWIDRGAQRN